MIPLVLAAMFLGLVTTASGQRRGQSWSPGGYGSIAYPGIGHAPATPAGGAAWPNLFGRPVSAARPSTATPGEIVILPFPVYDNSNLDEESGTYLPADGNPAQANTNLDRSAPSGYQPELCVSTWMILGLRITIQRLDGNSGRLCLGILRTRVRVMVKVPRIEWIMTVSQRSTSSRSRITASWRHSAIG